MVRPGRRGAGRPIPYLAPLLARAEESTRAALGTPTFQAQFAAGKRLSRGVAIGLALGEPAHGTAAAAGDAASPLRKRAAEVARLIADGLTNKQIGARLLISEHTIDSHIRSI